MKLIRDKTPDLIRGTTRKVVSDTEHMLLLQAKLMEEAAEAASATSTEEFIAEMGDLWEVFFTLCTLKGVKVDDVIKASMEKKLLKGGFSGGLVLEYDPLTNKV